MTCFHRFEKHYGKMANGSLCVTQAMQLELAQNWGIKYGILLTSSKSLAFCFLTFYFCVMIKDLSIGGVSICRATVLYDQPPEFFHPTLLEEKHKVSLVFLLTHLQKRIS